MSKNIIQMTDENGNNVFPVSAESGDRWIRFADGTQICWGKGKIVSNVCVVTFEKQFLNNPNIIANPIYSSGGSSHLRAITVMWTEKDKAELYENAIQYNASGVPTVSTSDDFYWMAIGRWK